MAGEEVEPLGVGALRGAEAGLQEVRRSRLVEERGLDARRGPGELRQRYLVDQRVLAGTGLRGTVVVRPPARTRLESLPVPSLTHSPTVKETIFGRIPGLEISQLLPRA